MKQENTNLKSKNSKMSAVKLTKRVDKIVLMADGR